MTWHPNIPLHYRDQIVTGDARALARDIPDASIDLVYTDPIYESIEDYAWLAETAARVLRPNASCLAWCGIGYLPGVLAAMSEHLAYRWQFIEYRTNEVKHRHAPGGKCLYSPLVWFDKGKHRPAFVLDVRAISVFSSPSNHMWSKPPLTIGYYLEAFTKPGAVVWEPFAGGGTILAACKMTNRHYIASEIDPATAERARERVLNTQPPLEGLIVEQASLLEVAS